MSLYSHAIIRAYEEFKMYNRPIESILKLKGRITSVH